MEELWNRLKNWLAENAPDILGTFNPSASSSDIEQVRAATQGQLPDLYEFLSLTNGQDEAPLLDDWYLLSSQSILREINLMRDSVVPSWKASGIDLGEAEVVGPIKLTLWDENWIPILSDGQNLMCLDLIPEIKEGGKVGQLIEWSRDFAPTQWISTGFRDWLSEFIESLEKGQIVLNSEGYSLTRN